MVVTPVFGFAWNLSEAWRVDLLGELGGHQVTGIGQSDSFDASQVKSVWLPSAGVRPSISARIPVGATRLVLSLTPFARWDLMRKTVTVNVTGSPSDVRTYEAGGSTIGVVGAVGLEI